MKQSQRTKNRLREHNIVFDMLRVNDSVSGFEGRTMVFADCSECGWFGWLPLDEVRGHKPGKVG
jgi:hypothetical protein